MERKVKSAKKNTVKKREALVLLDAHAILHRAYHALPAFTAPSGEETGALYGVVAMLLKIIEELSPTYLVACYDLPDPTYRHQVFKDYKAGRAKTDDALIAQIIRSRDIFTAFGIPMYEHPGFEADDILGTIVEATKSTKGLDVIIASGDMDTLQLIDKTRVRVYTLRKGIKDTILYDEQAVMDRFGFPPTLVPDYKGLRGDPSDNIPGIPGIGEKSGTELIAQFGSIEAIYKMLARSDAKFLEAGIRPRIIELLKTHEEEALFSKMLATIRRDAPIAFTLPEQTWRNALDVEKVLALFGELGFRTLRARVQMLFLPNGGTEASTADSTEPERAPTAESEEMEKAALALWLLESDTTNPTYEDVLSYARMHSSDAGTRSPIEIVMDALKDAGLEKIYTEIELPLREVLRTMERNGILLDTECLKGFSTKFHEELSELERTIYQEAGIEFNINSPKQLGDVLYEKLGLATKGGKRTATGQRSTRESELLKLKDQHPIIDQVLRHRELQKLLGTYIDNLPLLVKEDGRLHTTFLQAGAATGRMATTNPGLQNIPIRTDEGRAIRRAFVAAPGFKLIAIDYSQIELRIAAILSGDAKLIDIFKRGEDVHRGVALRVFGVNADAVTPEMRRRAKVINFGVLFGMGVVALRQNLGGTTTREEAQEFLNAYFNTFTRLADYLEETKGTARRVGYTETLFGRRRYFPGINSGAPMIRASSERMAINAPIQGTEGDVMRIAMIRIHAYLTANDLVADVRMLLQVHDELVFEIRKERIDVVVPEIAKIMMEVIPEDRRNGVPILVDAKAGDNWEEMEKIKV